MDENLDDIVFQAGEYRKLKDVHSLILNRGKKIITDTAKAVRQIPLDDGFVKACLAIAGCNSKIICAGMGKAGHAARKTSSTLCSLKIPSVYLHPGEASHGDSGIIEAGDILLAFSTSGKTREVIELVRLAKRLEVSHSIAITSHPDATIRKLCDIEVGMGIIEEAGYLHVAPTTSITVMLVVADMLATIAAELRCVTMDDFAIRHHGGYLGKKSRDVTKTQIKK